MLREAAKCVKLVLSLGSSRWNDLWYYSPPTSTADPETHHVGISVNGPFIKMPQELAKERLMKVRYTKIPDLLNPGQHGLYPLIQVWVRINYKSVLIHALVDSGAVDCLFPAFVAETLGIAIKSGDAQTYFGLGGRASVGYRHTIDLKVTGLEKWFKVEVGITENNLLLSILGQNGFFSNYQVIFERYRSQIEINTKENARARRRKGY